MKLYNYTVKTLSLFVASFVMIGIYGAISFIHNRSEINLATLLMVIASILLISFYYMILNFKIPKIIIKNRKNILISMTIIMFIAQLVVGISLYSRGHSWDVSVVEMLAQNYVDNGTTEVSEDLWEHGYLNRYDNNTPITLLITSILKVGQLIGASGHLLLYMTNGFLLFSSSAIVLYIVYKKFGGRYSVVAYSILFPLLTISPYVAIFYTDTVGIFFVSLIMLCIFKVSQANSSKHKKGWLIFLGLCAAIGLLIKPTVFIVMIALILSLIVVATTKSNKYNFKDIMWVSIPFILVLLFYNVTLWGLPNFAKYSQEEINAERVSFIHYLGMGSLRGLSPHENCKTGSYCVSYTDWIISDEGPKTSEGKKEYSLNLWKESVLTDFPTGYLGFMIYKIRLTFGDGSFGVWGEGSNRNEYIEFRFDDTLSRTIRNYLGPFGAYLDKTKLAWQIIWLTTLILMVFLPISAITRNFKLTKKANLTLLPILLFTFVGLIAYQMLFESRARYIFLYIPVFVLIAMGGLYCLNELIKKSLLAIRASGVIKLKQ
ncbi:hypothetical protein EOM27_01635 [Candidatus Saccharibacteria bacterium]|nr:hypothetical protein [Candidatus Saccharibacteria bacterium]